jgi:hypothetical protein
MSDIDQLAIIKQQDKSANVVGLLRTVNDSWRASATLECAYAGQHLPKVIRTSTRARSLEYVLNRSRFKP